MATSSKIQLDPSERLAFAVPNLTKESADKTSKLLQTNHDVSHIFFNQSGFHNHIVHHLLTLYTLGANPAAIQRQYDFNASYQRPIKLGKPERKAMDLTDANLFEKHLEDATFYYDYLNHFQNEITAKGWDTVLNEYLFSGTERADDFLVRLMAGFLHPIIHIGYGIEFKQPAIIAEALAQTALHDNWLGSFLVAAEKAATGHRNKEPKSLVQLLDEVQRNQKLIDSPHFNDDNKIRDGILKRAPEEMINFAAQYTVQPEDLDERTAEMINSSIYFTATAMNPKKVIKFDFYFIHCVNCSVFFPAINAVPQISTANKVRLLEWKTRTDLALYVSRRSPELNLQEILDYKPKQPKDDWDALFHRINTLDDDGHAPKLLRAVANGEKVSKPYEHKDSFRIKGDMWLQIGHMVVDSVEDSNPTWVRSCGFPEAWEEFPDRKTAMI